MAAIRNETRPVASGDDVVRVRHLVREWAVAAGFSLVDQTKLVTAASELARNVVMHAGGGEMRIETLNSGPKIGLRLTFVDRGPGIRDIEQAMRDGFTTSNGLGLGLGGSKRLVNEFEIQSRPGEGTKVAITRWK